MFRVGECVIYGSSGACRITDIRRESFAGEPREYYVLIPLSGGSSVFVPTDNEQLVARMRAPMTPEEAKRMLAEIPREEVTWIEDNRQRSARFQEILSAGSAPDLMRLTKAVWHRRGELRARGKKNLMADENAFKKAERILFGELSLVLGITQTEIVPYIEAGLAEA